MKQRILLLGVTGMLGRSLYNFFCKDTSYSVYGTVRRLNHEKYFTPSSGKIISDVDASNFKDLKKLIYKVKPNYLINCIGIIKQLDESKDYVQSITINSLLPHILSETCDELNCKLIHFSTDCVFDGAKGNYNESDSPNALDLYGQSKSLGEVKSNKHITLRTSIIGHELNSSHSLVDWFLGQRRSVDGYTKAIFSGLPTICIAEFLKDFVIGCDVAGLYHLSSSPISKYDLLNLISEIYGHDVPIERSDTLVIDRSLNSSALKSHTGYNPSDWREMINKMYGEYNEFKRQTIKS